MRRWMKDPPPNTLHSSISRRDPALSARRVDGTPLAPTLRHMLHRWTLLTLGLLGILAMGCPAKAPRESRPATNAAPTSDGYLTSTPAAPVGERMINTISAPTPAPVTTVATPTIRKPGSDEGLPSWVPISGRLSVVEAPDLAENLGLVPQGTTKAQGRISVADALAKSAAVGQNTAALATAPAPSGIRSATWLASNGRVRHSRR